MLRNLIDFNIVDVKELLRATYKRGAPELVSKSVSSFDTIPKFVVNRLESLGNEKINISVVF